MAKDPAFLMYSQDFYIGTIEFTNEEVGQYLRILLLEHQKGRMTAETIRLMVGKVSEKVLQKFHTDKHGKLYNKRFEKEVQKRNEYVNSRYRNGLKGGRPKSIRKACGNHKVNHIEDENEDKDLLKYIVNYLNEKAGTRYRSSSAKTKDKIRARLNEGYKKEDFVTVIDNKCTEWLGGEFARFLRPETLFGPKFEGYLNQPPKASGVKILPNGERAFDG